MAKCIPIGIANGARDTGGRKVPAGIPLFARSAHLKKDGGGDNVALYANEKGQGNPIAYVAPRHIVTM